MPRSAILTSARAVFRSYAAKCKALPRGAVRAWNSLFLHFSDQVLKLCSRDEIEAVATTKEVPIWCTAAFTIGSLDAPHLPLERPLPLPPQPPVSPAPAPSTPPRLEGRVVSRKHLTARAAELFMSAHRADIEDSVRVKRVYQRYRGLGLPAIRKRLGWEAWSQLSPDERDVYILLAKAEPQRHRDPTNGQWRLDKFRDDLPLAALITPEKPQAAQLRTTELARVGASFVREVENILETCWGSMFRAFLTFGMHKQRHAVGRLPPSNHARAWSTSRRCSTTFSTTSPAKSLGRVASCSS